MTDDDVIGAFPIEEIYRSKTSAPSEKELIDFARSKGYNLSRTDGVETILLNGGMILLVINRNQNFDSYPQDNQEGGFKDLRKKQSERDVRRIGNGSRQYQWKSTTADETFHNPYFKKWSPQSRKNKWITSGKTIRNNIKRPDSYCSGVSLYNPLT